MNRWTAGDVSAYAARRSGAGSTIVTADVSRLEQMLETQLCAAGVAYERELRFDPARAWRVDFVIPTHSLAIELEGLTHEGGRHQRIQGFTEDCEKYNALTLAGYRLLRFTRAHVEDGSAIRIISFALSRFRVSASLNIDEGIDKLAIAIKMAVKEYGVPVRLRVTELFRDFGGPSPKLAGKIGTRYLGGLHMRLGEEFALPVYKDRTFHITRATD